MMLPFENVERHHALSGGVGAEEAVGLENEGKPREKAREPEEERGASVGPENDAAAALEESDSCRDEE